MAQATLTKFYLSDPANPEMTVWINYHDQNLRIQSVEWDIQTGFSIRARVWDSDVLVYDQVHIAGTGSQSVPGNNKMVEDEFGNLDLPSNITYLFETV